MSFFDSKEEVIKIELTKYGKYLLSKGKFTPKFYSFYDDDIIYDSQYGGILEKQNDAQERILNETPYLKPQANFSSVNNDVNQLVEVLNSETDKKALNQTWDSDFLPYSIGSSDLNSSYLPSWNINILTGSISSSSPNIVANSTNPNLSYKFIKIPQINMVSGKYILSMYNDKIGLEDNEQVLVDLGNDNIICYSMENVYNLFDIIENNTSDNKENFSIEVFVEDDKTWRPLYFKKKINNIQDNILLDNNLNVDSIDFSLTDPSTVEHYFDIVTDMDAVPNSNKSSTIYSSPVNKDDQPFGDDC